MTGPRDDDDFDENRAPEDEPTLDADELEELAQALEYNA